MNFLKMFAVKMFYDLHDLLKFQIKKNDDILLWKDEVWWGKKEENPKGELKML